MKSKMLKLDAPYQVIYAGGYVGRHIATLVTWKEDEEGDMTETMSYPILDLGEEYPAGKMVMEDLMDCRVLCPSEGTNLYWVAKIIEYDFQQLEPAGIAYILERMKLLNCYIKLPFEKDEETGEEYPILEYKTTLDVWCVHGFDWEEDAIFRVKSNRCEGFYFQAEGTAHEIYNELSYQMNAYIGHFYDDHIAIKFGTDDGQLAEVCDKLNKDQGLN